MKWVVKHTDLKNLIDSDSFSHFSNERRIRAVANEMISKLLWIPQLVKLHLHRGESGLGFSETDEITVLAVEKGEIYIEGAALRGSLFSGQALLLTQSDSRYKMTAKRDARCISLTLSGSLTGVILGNTEEADQIFCPKGLSDVLEAMNSISAENTTPEKISSAAYQLLMRLCSTREEYQENYGYPMLVEAAIGIMQEDFAFLDGIEQLAEQLEVTQSYFIRLFTNAVGISPGKYLKRRRLEYAKTLLAQPDMPVALVADLSGFGSANYFAKAFRKEVGMSPHEYAVSHGTNAADVKPMQRMLQEAVM
ncbi:MAG: AraC family transcriptional regulator [Clostridiales bacterium]|nr:AraC family transcriptional regulator [Clostridiales bacterium]